MTKSISRKIEASSCCLHCLETGKPDAQAVLLLHGMKFSAATWDELSTLDLLAAAGCHCLALDMPGFGQSPVCESKHDTVLSEFIRQGEISKPVLIGPSMGGRIALEFALNHPGILGGMILVGAVGVEENKDRLSQLDLPVLLLWGGEDQISPLENSDTLLAAVKGANGAPHPCYLDQPETFHAVVIEFLQSL
ncbi:MAG: alpha/beta hydrolase [Desulfobulbus sp.]|nr:MAG: alpha/beta hydrolase [Desulfobulbus sp.]